MKVNYFQKYYFFFESQKINVYLYNFLMREVLSETHYYDEFESTAYQS